MTDGARARSSVCVHCRFPVVGIGDYCCRGCQLAHRFIVGAGLEKFYELRGTALNGPPRAADFERSRERLWLEALSAEIAAAEETVTVEVGISGLFCAACVWLIERSLLARPGAQQIVINSARATAELSVTSAFDMGAFAEDLEKLGYRLVPPTGNSTENGALLARAGIATALALNAMLLGAAIYLGLETGWLHRLFVGLSAALGAGSLVVGGGYFGRRALAALRARAISLDVPISLGIVLVFASSLWAAAAGRGDALYFDTLSVFVALMLAGRLLQERILRANRERITASDQLVDLGARVIRQGRPVSVSAASLAIGDRVLVPPGEVVPTDVRLVDERAGCRLEWITGESAPRVFRSGETICAGAINASRSALTGEVVAVLADTAIPSLLATPTAPDSSAAQTTRGSVAAVYLTAVLVAAVVGFVSWLLATGDVPRALEICAAVLVVTCPCALGIGAPLAFELTAASLAKAGAYVRTSDALAKLKDVRRVAFDKTGTLTDSGLVVANPEAFDALSERELHVLFNLAARSGHPHSVAIAGAIDGALDSSLSPTTEVGAGVAVKSGGDMFRLGRHDWAIGSANAHPSRETVFTHNGMVLARPLLLERLRPDADAELAALRAAGFQVSLVSGDRADRTGEVAQRLGIAGADVVSEASPAQKSHWVSENDRDDLLFVGDGLNDAPALEAATVAATPSFESPLVADRVDLYFNGRGLRPIRLALTAARALARIQRAQLGFVVVYNAVVVAVALAGWMKPWLAAVLMPTSSVVVTALTALAVRIGTSWKSSPS